MAHWTAGPLLTPPASTQHAFIQTGKEDMPLQGLTSLDVYDMDAPEISLFYGAEPWNDSFSNWTPASTLSKLQLIGFNSL